VQREVLTRTVAKILELEVVDLTVTEPPIEEVIGRVFSGGSVMSSIIRTRVLLSSYYAYMLEGPSYFCGLCLSLPLVMGG